MKIVVNICYGGFSLSQEAENFLMEKYGVTDNAIRKWCKAYNMPTKKNEIKEWLLKQ